MRSLLISVVALAIGLHVYADEPVKKKLEKAGESVQDASVTARIEMMYLMNDTLNPLQINTTTRGGVVTLEGKVTDDIERDLAEDLARSLAPVNDVKNQLIVAPDYEPTAADAPLQNVRKEMSEATLRAAVRSRLWYDKSLDGSELDVSADDRSVTLSGKVANADLKQEAERIALNTQGVQQVTNEIEVSEEVGESTNIVQKLENVGEKAGDAAASIGRALSDEWIEKRVESAIAMSENLSMRTLDVEVESGVCTLTGTTLSDEQRDLAERVATRTSGVKDVTNLIEVDATPLKDAS